MEDRLRVGVITAPHGIKGEVKVYPTTDDLNRFKKLEKNVFWYQAAKRLKLNVHPVNF